MIPFNTPFASGEELQRISEAIADKKLSGNGHFTRQVTSFFKTNYEFENTFLTTSCTAAIQMIAIALQLKKGDEIIIPSYTFSSTPNPFLINGAKVIFADSEPNHPNISVESLLSKITPQTKAIMVVHYGGYACDIEKIQAICREKNIILIEDAAQCIDAYYKGKPLGSFGDFSVFSFHETKNIHCGEGGLLVVNKEDYIDTMHTIWNYGTNKKAFLSGEVDSYEWTGIGLSFCMSEINAAYLYAQLLKIKDVTQKRKELWETYYSILLPLARSGKIELPVIDGNESSYHTFYLIPKDRDSYLQLQKHLITNFILAVQHYYPLHESKFAKEQGINYSLPQASKFGQRLLRLPLFYDLTKEQTNHICNKIFEFYAT